jgi:2-succinyl-6-hydroxy-2,4-cyclohexadiene-1-carboxylate synthase
VPDVLALHGFAGTGRMWQAVDPAWRAPDLPGHGEAGGIRPITFASCVEHVLSEAPERFTLVGYSMGGRVALHVALAAPERVERLVLVATTAGIADPGERAIRRLDDEAFADEIEHEPIETFVARWSANPLFAGDPPDAVAAWLADMRHNRPADLAAVLRGIGTGEMPSLWDRLGELTMPAVVMAGERDTKFRAIGERLAAALPNAAPLIVVPGAGHGLPREAPTAVRTTTLDQPSQGV